MATPAATRDRLIGDLRATRTRLLSPEWLSMIREAPAAQQKEAAANLMTVQLVLLDLENEALASFRDALIANEAAIAGATKKLQAALDRLQSVAKVLSAVTGFLKILGRVVALL